MAYEVDTGPNLIPRPITSFSILHVEKQDIENTGNGLGTRRSVI